MSRGIFIYFGEEGASLFLRYALKFAEREPGHTFWIKKGLTSAEKVIYWMTLSHYLTISHFMPWV
jgi:hypothetical protein